VSSCSIESRRWTKPPGANSKSIQSPTRSIRIRCGPPTVIQPLSLICLNPPTLLQIPDLFIFSVFLILTGILVETNGTVLRSSGIGKIALIVFD
jgi:hypothetical protein